MGWVRWATGYEGMVGREADLKKRAQRGAKGSSRRMMKRNATCHPSRQSGVPIQSSAYSGLGRSPDLWGLGDRVPLRAQGFACSLVNVLV